ARHGAPRRARHGRGVSPREPHLGAGERPPHRQRSARDHQGGRAGEKGLSRRRGCRLMLQIRDLETSYGASQVLFKLNFEIKTGEAVTLLGRNGMGKTTTVRSIMVLTRAKAGKSSFRGQHIRRER